MKKNIICLFLVFFLCFATTACQSLFFHPDRTLYYNPAICEYGPKNLAIETTDDLKIHAWLFRTKVENPKGTVIFMHGNSRNISTETAGMLWLLEKGYNLFTFDYRGYGASQGKPSIDGVMQDAAEALDGFMRLGYIDKNNLIIWGQSLGGAAASYTAANSIHADKVKILVLDSTFTSWRDIVKDRATAMIITWPFKWLIGLNFPDDKSSKIYVKESKIENTLIIHSKDDKFINIKHGKTLFELAHPNKEFFEYDKAGHAQIVLEPKNRQRILDYFDSVLGNK